MKTLPITIHPLLFALIILYSYFLFCLTDSFLEGRRRSGLLRVFIIMINSTAALFFIYSPKSLSYLAYFTLFISLIVEFSLTYRDKLARYLMCACSCALHVMAIRSIVTAVFAIVYDSSVYLITQSNIFFLPTMTITLLVLDLMILGVMKFVSTKMLKIICQHNSLLLFMIAWMSVFNIYLGLNAGVYSSSYTHPLLSVNQIVAPLVILIGLYIVLFFTFQTSSLLGYKEKSEELESAILGEQQYRESIAKDSLMSYEFNLSKNQMSKGFEKYVSDAPDITTYSEMAAYLANDLQHPEDMERCSHFFDIKWLIECYEDGQTETSVEYRRKVPNGSYSWVRSITNVVKDPLTGEFKGFTYVRDIDRAKKLEFALKRESEHDVLTGLYNRATTSRRISESIESGEGGALYIIDVDNFKSINDNFGHIYGDAVLCELSEKLLEIFSKTGIVGRLGGDEFLAYLRNPESIAAVSARAKRICEAFHCDYLYDAVEIITISSSVGVAIMPTHGATFEELYSKADVAMYAIKNSNKNGFSLYNGQDGYQNEGNRTVIDGRNAMIQKNFKENRIEYVFKILYAAEKPSSAIYSVLELVTKHFDFDRGYIFEFDHSQKTTSNTFEWCQEGVASQLSILQNLPIETIQTIYSRLHDSGKFFIDDISTLSAREYEHLSLQDVKSLFLFGLFDSTNLIGFIGFDRCNSERELSDGELDEMMTITNILSTFFVKQRFSQAIENGYSSLLSAINSLDSYAYVVRKNTYDMLFMNEKTAKLIGKSPEEDLICYRDFRGRTKPCPDCPLPQLEESGASHFTQLIYNDKFGIWAEATASHQRWLENEDTYFVNCINVNKFKG